MRGSPVTAEWVNTTDWRLVITDSGAYGCGFYYKLPSGWCFLEIAVHYGDRR